MIDVAIIGAGVVGLACGAALARRGRSVTVVERHAVVGHEASSRNSGVIHAGIYYPPGSLKSRTCVEGREMLYARCEQWGISYRRVGKLIIATSDDQVARLEALRQRGLENGAGDLELVDGATVRQWEPRIRAHAALWSPATGIVDQHALILSYRTELERYDGTIALHTRVAGLEQTNECWRVATIGENGETFELDTRLVVNCAGLGASAVAALAGIDTEAAGYRVSACKGDYFALAPALGELSQRLVYPVPTDAGLGIHLTVDLGGQYRLGPDTTFVDDPTLEVDADKAAAFADAVRPFLPEISVEHLSPDYSGLRPKLGAQRVGFRDFVIEDAAPHGAAGLINLIGIESPGLTAAGAIGELVTKLVQDAL